MKTVDISILIVIFGIKSTAIIAAMQERKRIYTNKNTKQASEQDKHTGLFEKSVCFFHIVINNHKLRFCLLLIRALCKITPVKQVDLFGCNIRRDKLIAKAVASYPKDELCDPSRLNGRCVYFDGITSVAEID